MKEQIESVLDTAKYEGQGFYAGDGAGFWVKCVDHETATQTRLKYIFFVSNQNKVTCYKA